MLKLTKTGIGLLTKQYRSLLRKCLLMNLGVLMCFCSRANASIEISYDATDIYYYGQSYSSIWYGHYTSTGHAIDYINLVTLEDLSNYYTKQEVNNIQSLNYYYTFRVDERVEVIEFEEELRSNKKEMSSLDFMLIKSSSDLRINLIKAEDPLTFSTKTRDDSLVLMEVCHA